MVQVYGSLLKVCAIRRTKYQRGGERRRGTKCCCRLSKVKANQSQIPQNYCRILKPTQRIVISLRFLLILDWIPLVQCTVPVCVSPPPQSGSSVWASWLVYYTPPGILSDRCSVLVSEALSLGAMCKDTLQATQTATMTTARQGGMQVSARVAPATPSATTTACVPFYERKKKAPSFRGCLSTQSLAGLCLKYSRSWNQL